MALENEKITRQVNSQETLQEERYLWMARAFSLVALLALVADVLMIMALSGLNPLIRVQPFYIQTQAKENQVISIIRPSKEELNDEVLQESLVREYLLARYGIGSDVNEVEQRWGVDGKVAAMSSPSVYQEFVAIESQKMLRDQIPKEGLTRDVIINVANLKERYPDGRSVWIAEMELVDRSQKLSDVLTSKWNVVMEIIFQPTNKNLTWSHRLKNPLGFRVTKFGRKTISENNNAS